MQAADIAAARRLWQAVEGVGLSAADEPAALASFLDRNPGLSFVAEADGALVGAVLCGHDGRRGYIHHLAVAPAYRRQGLGEALTDHCLHALARAGIGKCHLFVFRENAAGQTFWRITGWTERVDLALFSREIE